MATAADKQRPIVIRRVKKVVAAGHHGGAWKVAYADFVTAMMAFFMLLWLLANPDEQRLQGLAEYFSPSSPSAQSGETIESIAAATEGLAGQRQPTPQKIPKSAGSPVSPAASSGAQSGGTAAVPDPTLRIVAEELRLLLQSSSIPSADRMTIQMERSRDGLRVSLMDDDRRSMFKPGTAILNGYARNMLGEVARKLARTELRVAIEGHTDGVGGRGQGNWALSSARALAAQQAVVAGGLPADKIAEVVALADTQPVYPDQPARPENRRITLVLLAEGSPLPDLAAISR